MEKEKKLPCRNVNYRCHVGPTSWPSKASTLQGALLPTNQTTNNQPTTQSNAAVATTKLFQHFSFKNFFSFTRSSSSSSFATISMIRACRVHGAWSLTIIICMTSSCCISCKLNLMLATRKRLHKMIYDYINN